MHAGITSICSTFVTPLHEPELPWHLCRLCAAGAELASTCRSQKGERGCALMLLTTAAILGTKNTAIGFLAGEHPTICSPNSTLRHRHPLEPICLWPPRLATMDEACTCGRLEAKPKRPILSTIANFKLLIASYSIVVFAGAGAALLIFLYDRAIRVHRKRSMLRDYRQQESYQPLNA